MGRFLTNTFAKLSSGENGYLANSAGLSAHASDIMSRTYSSDSVSSENLYETKSLKAAFAKSDPIYGERPSFKQSLIQGDTQTTTAMSNMYVGRSYKAENFNAGSMAIDPNKSMGGSAKKVEAKESAQADVQKNITNFQSDWKQAKREALSALTESAKDMNISPTAAVDSIIPDAAPTKAAAVAYVAAELAVGGGTLATIGKAAFFGQELSEQEKKLPLEKQQALLEETVTRLQASSASNPDSRAQDHGGSIPADAPKQSEIAWENMQIEELDTFLKADPDGLDQPEMKTLLNQDKQLDEVDSNHVYAMEHYADKVSSDKAPDYDAGSVALAGDSLAGVSLYASQSGFSSDAAQAVLAFQTPEAAHAQLDLEARAQLAM